MYVVIETIITLFVIAIAFAGAGLIWLGTVDAFKRQPIFMGFVVIAFIGLGWWFFEEYSNY